MITIKNNETLVALYGTLTRKGKSHWEIENINVEYIGDYITKPIYKMLNISNLYPAVLENGSDSIKVEIYKIKSLIFENIINEIMGYDPFLEESGLFLKKSIKTPFGNAYIYYYNRKQRVDDSIIESGDWIYELSDFNKNTQLEYEKIQMV
jgi:gamma-glutamylcyclotransferase (GGCT)/AIG2-like uncharacterized protein YtfP